MEPADTFVHAGLGVRICWEEFDQEHANPRSDDGNIGVMSCDHSRYTLGDEDADDPRDQTVPCEACGGDGYADDDEVCAKCEGEGEVEVGVLDYLKRNGATVVLPLFLYDHSGITISAGANLLTGEDNFRRSGRFMGDGAGWDTSSVGVIYDTPETRAQLDDQSPKNVERILDAEVELYAAYLEGSVFGYEIVELDEDGEVPEDDAEVLDSCWGFLEVNVHSDDAGVRQEAKWAAESEAKAIEREKQEALRWACADVVTV